MDTPPAVMDPDALVREAQAVAAALNARPDAAAAAAVTATVLRYDALKAGGFGGLVAVGEAAARDGREPALVHLKFCPPGAAAGGRSVGLVGKGRACQMLLATSATEFEPSFLELHGIL